MDLQIQTNHELFRVAQDSFEQQFQEQKRANEQLFNLTESRLNPPKNYSEICFDWFKISDIGLYMSGHGFNKTGLTFPEWSFSQSPFASMIVGPVALIARYFDTQIASRFAKNMGLKLHCTQKVRMIKNIDKNFVII